MAGDERGDVPVATRRRVIDTVMSRRAHLTVGDLHHLLARLDIDVSSQTVVAPSFVDLRVTFG